MFGIHWLPRHAATDLEIIESLYSNIQKKIVEIAGNSLELLLLNYIGNNIMAKSNVFGIVKK